MDTSRGVTIDMLIQMQPFLSSLSKSAQGLVDLYLRASYPLKEEDDLPFFEKLLTTFSTDIGIEIETVTEMLSRIDVDLKDLYESCIKLKGCIGVVRVHKACQNLGEASVNKHKDGCLVALDLIKSEYDTVESQLKILLEMSTTGSIVGRRLLNSIEFEKVFESWKV